MKLYFKYQLVYQIYTHQILTNVRKELPRTESVFTINPLFKTDNASKLKAFILKHNQHTMSIKFNPTNKLTGQQTQFSLTT